MATMHTEERIGEAWKQHRMNNNSAAIEIFEDVLNSHPKDLDAIYGLGLAQRANGNNSDAIAAFQKALELAQEGLEAVDNTSMLDGHGGSNNLDTDQDDRFLMLTTMIKQRLTELGQ